MSNDVVDAAIRLYRASHRSLQTASRSRAEEGQLHPDQSIAMSRTYQREALRHAEAARRAAEVPREERPGQLRLSLPRIAFARRAAAIRATIAHA